MELFKPMLAEMHKGDASTFKNREDFFFEPKIDGVRCLAYIENGQQKLIGRAGNDYTSKFPEIQIRLKDCSSAVIDGELFDTDFGTTQSRVHSKAISTRGGAVFYGFTLLAKDGQNLCNLGERSRKSILTECFYGEGIKLLFDVEDLDVLWASVEKHNMEGVMAKRTNGCYHPGKRTFSWIKIKTWKTDEFWIAGVTKGIGYREAKFGAFVLANDKKEYVGCCSGFDDKILQNAEKYFEDSGVSKITQTPKTTQVKTWYEPKIKAKVRFLEYGTGGHLRFPVFEGFIV